LEEKEKAETHIAKKDIAAGKEGVATSG